MLTDQQHPITPPPELVEQLRNDAPHGIRDAGVTRERHLAIAAYHAGADAELEACCEWLREAKHHGLGYEVGAMLADRLRAAMRPKPPSAAEEASKALDRLPGPGADSSYLRNWADKEAYGLRCAVRRALERLQELEKGAND